MVQGVEEEHLENFVPKGSQGWRSLGQEQRSYFPRARQEDLRAFCENSLLGVGGTAARFTEIRYQKSAYGCRAYRRDFMATSAGLEMVCTFSVRLL